MPEILISTCNGQKIVKSLPTPILKLSWFFFTKKSGRLIGDQSFISLDNPANGGYRFELLEGRISLCEVTRLCWKGAHGLGHLS